MFKTCQFSVAYFVLPLVTGATVLIGEAAQADVAIANGIGVGARQQLYAQLQSGPPYAMRSRPRSDYDRNYGDGNRGGWNRGDWNRGGRDHNRQSDNRQSDRDSSDRITEGAILINPVLIDPVIINPYPSGQTVFRYPYSQPSTSANPACTLFVHLRPACR